MNAGPMGSRGDGTAAVDRAATGVFVPPRAVPEPTLRLTVFGAAGGTAAPPHTLSGWFTQTRGRFGQLAFDGGHFHFLGPAFPAFAARPVEEIRPALRPAPDADQAGAAQPVRGAVGLTR